MGFFDEETIRLIRRIHASYHHPSFIHPDPLSIVRTYTSARDREVAALVCSSLALGRVQGILTAADRVLAPFPHPADDLLSWKRADFRELFDGFVYRFFGAEEISAFLSGIRGVLEEYGSLEACFRRGLRPGQENVIPVLTDFVEALSVRSGGRQGMLLSSPAKGGAAKRLHLFLRWLVRNDEIDPGGWTCIPPSLLLYPMDTHMLAVARFLRLPVGGTADQRTALTVTGAFREIDRDDPVRFDFSLTRPGIHPALSAQDEFRRN